MNIFLCARTLTRVSERIWNNFINQMPSRALCNIQIIVDFVSMREELRGKVKFAIFN